LPVPARRNSAAADGITLTVDQITTLDQLTPAEGGHHTEAQMQMIERRAIQEVGRRRTGKWPPSPDPLTAMSAQRIRSCPAQAASLSLSGLR
jgi:hypothetical protein